MSTPSRATRRHARDGRTHLTLVTGQDTPATPTDSGNTPQPGKKDEPTRIVPLSGSATVRALIALGALISALGLFNAAKSAADVLSRHQSKPQYAEEEQPHMETTPHTTPAAPGRHRAPDLHTVPAAYTLPTPPPAPTGRHRKPYTLERAPGRRIGTGRHRRPTTATSCPGPQRTSRPSTRPQDPSRAGVSVRVSLPVGDLSLNSGL